MNNHKKELFMLAKVLCQYTDNWELFTLLFSYHQSKKTTGSLCYDSLVGKLFFSFFLFNIYYRVYVCQRGTEKEKAPLGGMSNFQAHGPLLEPLNLNIQSLGTQLPWSPFHLLDHWKLFKGHLWGIENLGSFLWKILKTHHEIKDINMSV